MKASVQSNDFSLQNIYNQFVLPLLHPVAEHDRRRSNARHSALDALKAGFAMFHLKAASLNGFEPRLANEEHNLRSIFAIESLPSANGLRSILDELPATELNRQLGSRLLPYLEQHRLLEPYCYWNGHLICTIDGVQHQCSNKVKCPHCLVRNHRNGTQSFSHSMLTAAIVRPGGREVFVVNNEPILRQDAYSEVSDPPIPQL